MAEWINGDDDRYRAAVLEYLRRELQIRLAKEHPAYFLQHVTCVDSRTGEEFRFTLLDEKESERVGIPYRGDNWVWQREYLDWIVSNEQTITLKGRQLGVTWVWAGLALYTALYKPGSDVLVYSIKEDDAVEVVNRIWDMWLSLPGHFQSLVEVVKPTRGVRPSTRIEFRHPDGRMSTIAGMAATKSAGHGRSAALVVFDEASRQEYARELWKAVVPAMGDKGGKLGVVSTANGMSDGKGQGNFFHELWVGAGHASYPRLQKQFLGWYLHPERSEVWYDNVSLPEAEKAEQYPNDADEAFLLSGSPFFANIAMRHYARNKIEPLYRGRFTVNPNATYIGRLTRGDGPLEVFVEPTPGGRYAIGADVATGLGTDFSVAAVVDLTNGAPVAELYMKAEYEEFAEQLHFLALWYNQARVAVETGGGYGDTVIAYLRDGLAGRKPYPKLYRHKVWARSDRPMNIRFGFPMNSQTRPKVINELRMWVEEKLMPWMPDGLFQECQTFVYRDTRPSPRGADGCNDDRVMAWAIAYEMYAEYGSHEQDRKNRTRATLTAKKSSTQKRLYPWSYA